MAFSKQDLRLMDLLLARIDHPAYVVDKDFKIVYINEFCRHITFYDRNVQGMCLFDAFQDLRPDNSVVARVMRTGTAEVESLDFWTSITGEKRVSLASAYPIIEGGEVIGVFEMAEPLSNLDQGFRSQLMQQGIPHLISSAKAAPTEAYYTVDDIVGESESIRDLRQQIRLIGNNTSNLLIYGATGTGKEMVAQAVYSLSKKQRPGPFIAQNCAAIPETLLESILFGTVKGSFTGAESTPGLFELANNGTLFLDELNAMPVNLQAKLLRVLQDGKVRRLGDKKETRVNVRLIAAVNVAPKTLISQAVLREDLFYRLGVFYLHVPQLRERKDDIPQLLMYFLSEFNESCGKKVMGFDKACMDFFMGYHWPGNVRELRNITERAVNMATGRVIEFDLERLMPYSLFDQQLPAQEPLQQPGNTTPALPAAAGNTLKDMVAAAETAALKDAIAACGGNIAKAARRLDIPQQTMNNKLGKYGLRDYAQQQKVLKKQHQ